MHWHEKIDRIKKSTDPKDFRDPFKDGAAIRKRIHDRFFTPSEDYNLGFFNWSDGLRNKVKVKDILPAHLDDELSKLDQNQNYWIVLADRTGPFAEGVVYDAKPAVIQTLAHLWRHNFYIGDKKYNWIIWFNRTTDDVSLYRSGPALPPGMNPGW